MFVDIVSGLLLIIGSTFMLIAAIGIIRFPDLLMRMHASTKAGSLGASTVLIASAVFFPTTDVLTSVITAVVFILLTAPVAAHVIGRAAYHLGVELWEGTLVDELQELVDEIEEEIERKEGESAQSPLDHKNGGLS